MSNAEYWSKRQAQAENHVVKNMDKAIINLYKQTCKNIENELLLIWNDMLEKGDVSMSALYSHERYRSLQELIYKKIADLGRVAENQLQTSLIDMYVEEYKTTNALLDSVRDFTILDQQVAKTIVNSHYKGATFSERIWKNMNLLQEQLQDVVTQSAISGKDVRKISKDIQGRFNVSYNDSKRLVITETNRCFNEACRTSALNNGYDTFHVLIEPDACEECKKFKDKTYNLNESVLPAHPYCKCTTIIDIDLP